MRILAAADLHGDLGIYSWLIERAGDVRPDAVVLAGDLLGKTWDHPGPIEAAHRENADAIIGLLRGLAAPVLYIMGNDDMVELDPQVDGMRSVHAQPVALGEFNFVGYQYSPPFMGGIHEKPEDEIRSDLAQLTPLVDERTVFVTHAPAHGILDIGVLDRHAGSPSILDVVTSRRPLAHIHGHIHAHFGRHDKHFNVAAAGRKRAVLIDLTTLEHEVLEAP